MFTKFVLVLTMVLSVRAVDLNFPPGFKFGVATSAYQIEGGWNVSDKSESVWDYFTHQYPDRIADHSTGDVACDSYNQWRNDVKILKDLGVHFYRFSLSWTRILPSGFSNYVSEDGVRYYSDLIDELLLNGIKPMVTICHWDIPQRLQNLGGWTNPLIADWFAGYADVVFSLYASKVKTWVTINEPQMLCDMAYNVGALAPGIVDPEIGDYLCSKNVLIAHAKAWRLYDQKYRAIHNGRVAISNQITWHEGKTKGEDYLADIANQLMGGRFAHPIFSESGGWPPIIEKLIAEKSKIQGYARSRLPSFTPEEIKLIKGTYDFFALNHYTSRIVFPAAPGEKLGPFPAFDVPEFNLKAGVRKNWTYGYAKLLPTNPPGLRHIINWITKNYGPQEIMITENGYSSGDYELNDSKRIRFIRDYLRQVLLAIKDGANVTTYTYWTLMDNFEWMDGFKSKFGLYEMRSEDPLRRRVPRASAIYYSRIIQNNSLDVRLDNENEIKRLYLKSEPNLSFSITNISHMFLTACVMIVLFIFN